MKFGWLLGAMMAGLGLSGAAQAAPLPALGLDAAPSVRTVQFFYYDDPPPPPPVYYYDPPPPPYYGPRRRYYRAPPPAASPPYPGPAYGFYDKDTTKAYRQQQKELYKERVRAWNRANGY